MQRCLWICSRLAGYWWCTFRCCSREVQNCTQRRRWLEKESSGVRCSSRCVYQMNFKDMKFWTSANLTFKTNCILNFNVEYLRLSRYSANLWDIQIVSLIHRRRSFSNSSKRWKASFLWTQSSCATWVEPNQVVQSKVDVEGLVAVHCAHGISRLASPVYCKKPSNNDRIVL